MKGRQYNIQMSSFQRHQMILPEVVEKKLLQVLLVLTVAMLLAGCSGEEAKSVPAVGGPTAAPTLDPAAPSAVGEPTMVTEPRSTNEATAQRPTTLPTVDQSTPVPTDGSLPDEVQLRILAINDFHGSIATTSGAFDGVGRADYLAANIAAARAEAANSIFVSAGDLIGASPLISALFHDEPTIEAMNLMGLEFNGVGNHEFDDGRAELARMQQGGPHPDSEDGDSEPFRGAEFQFLAANVIDETGNTIFPAYGVRDFLGIKVAFIGLTLEGTPGIVARGRVAGLSFLDEAETVNALIPELREQGIEAIVVLLHHGGFSDGGKDDCGTGLDGPVAEIVPMLDSAVDLVIAGHTNDEFVCEIDGKWVTMADNGGRLFTVIDVILSRSTGDLAVKSAVNVPNSQDGVTPVPALTDLIEKYERLVAPRANAVVGIVTGDISREQNDAGESALGNVLADAHLAATSSPDTGNAVVAFMNPGGIRDEITFASSGLEADGELTYGEAFSVHPFGNSMVTMTLTGAQIDTLLEQQFRDEGTGYGNMLQPSAGFQYTWDAAAPLGSKVELSTIAIQGVPIAPDASYRVTVNSYLAGGGSGFSVLLEGTERIGGDVDVDALVAYFAGNAAVAPGPQDRIMRLN